MEIICPYYKANEDMHTMERSAVMEHLMGCREKVRPCEIPFCTFHGSSKQMEVHNRNAMAHHNALLFKAHEELIQQIKLKPEDARKAYVLKKKGMWSSSWKIENLSMHMRRSQSQGLPMQSPVFHKLDQVWRLVLFYGPSHWEVNLQLVSSMAKLTTMDLTLTFMVEHTVYKKVRGIVVEGEMLGTAVTLKPQSAETLDIQVAVTISKYTEEKTKSSSINKNTNETQNAEETAVKFFIDNLEQQGTIQKVLRQAEQVARKLPEEIGRGGIIGFGSFKTLDKSVKEVFEARLHAPDSIADVVDDIVINRYLTLNRNTQSAFSYDDPNYSNLDLKAFGNKTTYISGYIIKLLNENDKARL